VSSIINSKMTDQEPINDSKVVKNSDNIPDLDKTTVNKLNYKGFSITLNDSQPVIEIFEKLWNTVKTEIGINLHYLDEYPNDTTSELLQRLSKRVRVGLNALILKHHDPKSNTGWNKDNILNASLDLVHIKLHVHTDRSESYKFSSHEFCWVFLCDVYITTENTLFCLSTEYYDEIITYLDKQNEDRQNEDKQSEDKQNENKQNEDIKIANKIESKLSTDQAFDSLWDMMTDEVKINSEFFKYHLGSKPSEAIKEIKCKTKKEIDEIIDDFYSKNLGLNEYIKTMQSLLELIHPHLLSKFDLRFYWVNKPNYHWYNCISNSIIEYCEAITAEKIKIKTK
jgi:hypothetical protein